MFTKQPSPGLISLMFIIYGLHGFSALNGLLSPAFVVTAFLSGWPSIIAVILSYVKIDDAEGTFLQSHFRWMIRTFWFAFVWLLIAGILLVTVVGIPLAILILIAVGLWVLYRIIRGLLLLLDEKPVVEMLLP